VTGLKRRLEFIDGAFVSKELVYGATVVDTPTLREQEAQVAEDMLLRMSRACRDRGVGFAVVLLYTDPFPPRFAHALGQAGIALLDLTSLPLTTFRYDAHPDADGHRKIADTISASFLTEFARP